MVRKLRAPAKAERLRWDRGAEVPLRIIRAYARQVAERFQPEKIILFGSQLMAHRTPTVMWTFS